MPNITNRVRHRIPSPFLPRLREWKTDQTPGGIIADHLVVDMYIATADTRDRVMAMGFLHTESAPVPLLSAMYNRTRDATEANNSATMTNDRTNNTPSPPRRNHTIATNDTALYHRIIPCHRDDPDRRPSMHHRRGRAFLGHDQNHHWRITTRQLRPSTARNHRRETTS